MAMPSESMFEFSNKFKDEMTARKGAWWTRKVFYVVGMRAICESHQNERMQDKGVTLLAGGIIDDLMEKFPERSITELNKEILADCQAYEDAMIEEAVKIGDLK